MLLVVPFDLAGSVQDILYVRMGFYQLFLILICFDLIFFCEPFKTHTIFLACFWPLSCFLWGKTETYNIFNLRVKTWYQMHKTVCTHKDRNIHSLPLNICQNIDNCAHSTIHRPEMNSKEEAQCNLNDCAS